MNDPLEARVVGTYRMRRVSGESPLIEVAVVHDGGWAIRLRVSRGGSLTDDERDSVLIAVCQEERVALEGALDLALGFDPHAWSPANEADN